MAAEKKFLVVGIGEILWDIYREDRYVGGSPANFALHISQMGDEAVVVSRIGNDGMGEELVRELEKRGITSRYLQIDRKKGTGIVHISLGVNGEPRFICSEDVAFDYLQFDRELEPLARSADAVLFGLLAQRTAQSHETVQKFVAACGGLRVFDLNGPGMRGDYHDVVVASLEKANVVKLNDQELERLKRTFHKEGDADLRFSRFLIEQFQLRFIALTRGALGAAIITKNEVFEAPALPIKVEDATGAGDAFAAGMVHALLRDWPLDEVLQFANLVAAYVCTRRGANPQFSMQDLQEFSARVLASQRGEQ